MTSIRHLGFACYSGLLLVLASVAMGCQAGDPVAAFIQQQDSLPPAQRVPDWETTKRLMLRSAPRVGDPAPDFTLATIDGEKTITRSEFHEGRPLVLIFGSFT